MFQLLILYNYSFFSHKNFTFLQHKKFHIKQTIFFILFSNQKRELNDIRFEFAVGVDSAEGIAAELVGAGLVDGKDIVVIAANLQKLIDSAGQLRTVTFSLVNFNLNLIKIFFKIIFEYINYKCYYFRILVMHPMKYQMIKH